MKPELSVLANPSGVRPSPFIWEWGAIRDDRPAEGADGGGKALWATGADAEAVEELAFIFNGENWGWREEISRSWTFRGEIRSKTLILAQNIILNVTFQRSHEPWQSQVQVKFARLTPNKIQYLSQTLVLILTYLNSTRTIIFSS